MLFLPSAGLLFLLCQLSYDWRETLHPIRRGCCSLTRAPIPEGHGREGSSFHRPTAETGNAQHEEDGRRGVWHLPVLAGLSLRLAVPARGREMSLPIPPASPGGSPPLQAAVQGRERVGAPPCLCFVPALSVFTYVSSKDAAFTCPVAFTSRLFSASYVSLFPDAFFAPSVILSTRGNGEREKKLEDSELCLGKKCFLFCWGLL